MICFLCPLALTYVLRRCELFWVFSEFLPTTLALEVMQLPQFIHPSVCPSVCLFPHYLFNWVTFDLDLLHMYRSWLGLNVEVRVRVLIRNTVGGTSIVSRGQAVVWLWVKRVYMTGVSNSLVLFCAALSDHKVLLHSDSFSRLTDTCQALSALMYPLKYRSPGCSTAI